jgi:flagellar biosynthetic protein FliS
MSPNDSHAYRQLDTFATDPLEIIAKTFHLAAASCDEARRACESGDILLKGASVNKVATALALLRANLDRDRGMEVAETMDRTYGILIRRLTTAHATNDLSIFDEVAAHLRGLGSAWEEAARLKSATPGAPGDPGTARLDQTR